MIRRAAVFASVSLLVACNGLTGIGDLHVTGDGGAGGSASRGAGNNGGASGVGGAGPGSGPTTNGAGPATSGAGPSTTTGAGPSTSAAGPATTTGAGPATTTGAGPSTTTGAGPGPASVAASTVASTGTGGMDPAQMCVDFINQKRATIGLGPLARDPSQEVCTGNEAHTDANNMTAHSAFGTCGEWAQNECPGWPGPPEAMIDNCLQMMWNEGPGSDYSTHGHYINMTNTSYTKVACGFYVLGDGSVWAAQDFWP